MHTTPFQEFNLEASERLPWLVDLDLREKKVKI